MDKIFALARLIAVILAIVSAFVNIPMAAVALLILGAISAINGDSEQNTRTYLIAIVLTLGAGALDPIPAIGPSLVTIFAALGTAAIGGSVAAIAITFAMRIKSDWMK